MILLVRHAVATARQDWDGDDARRPLTGRGRRQAEGLVELLARYPIERIVSSPTARCTGTVGPLAEARGLRVKTSKLLREGRAGDGLDLVLDAAGEDVALCTHGDVVRDVLAGLRRLGWPVPPRPGHAKGSVWVLGRDRCEHLRPVG